MGAELFDKEYADLIQITTSGGLTESPSQKSTKEKRLISFNSQQNSAIKQSQ